MGRITKPHRRGPLFPANVQQDCDVDYQHWSLAQQVTMMMWCTQLTLMNGTEEDEDSTA